MPKGAAATGTQGYQPTGGYQPSGGYKGVETYKWWKAGGRLVERDFCLGGSLVEIEALIHNLLDVSFVSIIAFKRHWY